MPRPQPFELRASEVANPHPSDQLTVGGETFIIQAGRAKLVWTLDVRPAAAGPCAPSHSRDQLSRSVAGTRQESPLDRC